MGYEIRPLHRIERTTWERAKADEDLGDDISTCHGVHHSHRRHDDNFPERNEFHLASFLFHSIHPSDMDRVLGKYFQVPSLPTADTMSILVGFASQKDEAGSNEGDTADSPDYALHVSREVKAPGNKVNAAVG